MNSNLGGAGLGVQVSNPGRNPGGAQLVEEHGGALGHDYFLGHAKLSCDHGDKQGGCLKEGCREKERSGSRGSKINASAAIQTLICIEVWSNISAALEEEKSGLAKKLPCFSARNYKHNSL